MTTIKTPDQNTDPLALFIEREELKSKSTWKNRKLSLLQEYGEERREAKQSSENLKLGLSCFSINFPRYVGDSFMH